MAANGVDIAVGQRWKTRVGDVVEIVSNDGHKNFPWNLSNGGSVDNNGAGASRHTEHEDDLRELVQDSAGDFMGVPVKGGVTPEPTARLVPTAPGLLDKAAAHMRERAATYDSPGGERSMAKTVALFNLHHDMALTEAQGWHFMQILKDVRLFSAKGYHADSAEDKIAYAALMSEAKAKEGV